MKLLFRILIGLIAFAAAINGMLDGIQIEGAQPFSRDLDQPAPFNQTCTVGSYLFDLNTTTLGMYCNNDDVKNYAYDWTFIDLNLCLANHNGALVPSPGGNFSDSCSNCAVNWSHIYLDPVTTTITTIPHYWITATYTSVSTPRWDDLYLGCSGCSNAKKQMPTATIDLNKVMTNNNGTIGCNHVKGTTRFARPDPTMTKKADTTRPGITPRATMPDLRASERKPSSEDGNRDANGAATARTVSVRPPKVNGRRCKWFTVGETVCDPRTCR